MARVTKEIRLALSLPDIARLSNTTKPVCSECTGLGDFRPCAPPMISACQLSPTSEHSSPLALHPGDHPKIHRFSLSVFPNLASLWTFVSWPALSHIPSQCRAPAISRLYPSPTTHPLRWFQQLSNQPATSMSCSTVAQLMASTAARWTAQAMWQLLVVRPQDRSDRSSKVTAAPGNKCCRISNRKGS